MTGPASGPASEPGASGVIAWGPEGCWVGDEAGDLQRLGGAAAASPVPPCALAGSVWRVDRDGAVERWQREAPGAWRRAWRHAFAQAVHALAVAEDGRFVLAAHGEQASLLDAGGRPLKAYEGRDATGTRHGAAQAVFALAGRRSFAVAWPALGEVWEIALDPQAPPIFEGWVHDYRMGEGLASRGYLGARRSPLGLPLPRMRFADARVPWLAGTLDDDTVAVVHLDVRRRLATLPLPGARLEVALLRRGAAGAAGTGGTGGTGAWWVPVDGAVQVVDTSRWQLLERLHVPGPVQALQEVGGTAWAALGAPGAAALHVLRGGEWQRVAGMDVVQAMAADDAGRRLLVATRGPAGLAVLDAEGRTLQRRALPGAADLGGVAWWRG